MSKILENIIKKTMNGKEIPVIDKNGVNVHALTIFEDIIVRNLDNLDTVAIEINGNTMTYLEFFLEVEKYMNAFENMGLKSGDVVSLCLPVGVEFICSYFALTTLGIACNAVNIMFLLTYGVKKFSKERCSHTMICYNEYFKLLQAYNAFDDETLKRIVITGDETYAHFKSDHNVVDMPSKGIQNAEIISFDDFINNSMSNTLNSVDYDENRLSTLTYTSGTTGMPKCIGHSDLAPLFLVAAHDYIKRNEHKGDRTLITIPMQHPTGLFYSMVLQMAEGKTLVLEPRYDKTLFGSDIRDLKINHAVQAKPFYAQLVQDRKDGKLKPGDFILFRNGYSGGEGIPLPTYLEICDTLKYLGCDDPLYLGYGRSEEGSLVVTPYNLIGRQNSSGVALPGCRTKLVNPETLEDIENKPGAKGEIIIDTPVKPMYNHYLGAYNQPLISDGSFVDKDGIRWSRPGDISTLIEMPNGTLSNLVLGRASDKATKGDVNYYLFELKELISQISGVQECEVLSIKNHNHDYITVHIVLTNEAKNIKEEIIQTIQQKFSMIDGVKFYDIFGINATSGKCDRESMQEDLENYFALVDGHLSEINFEKQEDRILKRVKSL